MCFKLDNGSELFSVHDMQRLRKKSSGAMGSRAWAMGVAVDQPRRCSGGGNGTCLCAVKCPHCTCLETLSETQQ